MQQFLVHTTKHVQVIDITQKIQKQLPKHTGAVLIYTPHTTCALIINEGADPAVQADLLKQLDALVPWKQMFFTHTEGNSAAHIKSVLVGNSVHVILENGKLQLGTWEHLFLCEFDGPRERKVWFQLLD